MLEMINAVSTRVVLQIIFPPSLPFAPFCFLNIGMSRHVSFAQYIPDEI
jgi:hypothetical protein